mgnify:CR=1 FL=1
MKTGVIKLTLEQHNTLSLIHKANAGLLTVQEAALFLYLKDFSKYIIFYYHFAENIGHH